MTSLSVETALLDGSDPQARSTVGHGVGRLVDGLVLLFVVTCCTWIFSLPMRSHGSLLGFAQDDFYYYLKAAQNLAAGRGSTFDGTTLTNGYHPLYFLLWTCAAFAIHSLQGVFRLLWLLDVVSATAIFLAARNIFRKVTPDSFLANAFALAVLVPCIATISFQMEVTLALPLAFAFLATGCVAPARYTPARCAMLGLLGALTMLGRLDAGILVLLFLVGLFTVRGMRGVLTARNIASFSATALPPLLLYFALNRYYFHEWLPISGAAKQLRHGWKPDLLQMRLSFAGFTLPLLAVTLLGCLAVVVLRKRLQPQEKSLCIAALLMPLVFYTVESFVSAWKLWGWYMYAFRISWLAALLLLLIFITRRGASDARSWMSTLQKTAWLAPLALTISLLTLARTHYKVDEVMVAIADEDTALNEFAKAHPGRYAMGDRAGMFGYLSSSPLIQTEGLMMDRQFLQHIRHEDDLLHTLQSYRIDYYVQYLLDADAGERLNGTCLRAQEPSIAGKDALRMRSTLCGAPIAALTGHGGKLLVYQLSPGR